MTTPPRGERRERLERRPPDVCVVGGGITGAGIALELALRGVDVALFERSDWASATSSASSRLVHGGLRYLEQLEISLVRESCLERARLLTNAAGLVWPERFLFPVRRGDRVGPVQMSLGLGLYGLVSLPRPLGWPHLVGRRRAADAIGGLDADALRCAGSYLDAATDDSRLALAVVLSAIRAGATCLSRCAVDAVDDGPGGASLEVHDLEGDETFTTSCRAVVLAGGPFTEELRERAGLGGRWISPTRGSHVVVPRERLPTDGAVIFPSRLDGRVMFLIPWPHATVLGTTDLDDAPDPGVRATREEVQYLLDSANDLVPGAALTQDDVISTWSGLRPLLAADADPSARSREERVVNEGNLWTIAGGKLTGYRSMAEGLADALCAATSLGSRRSRTKDHALVGALARPVRRPAWSDPATARGLDPRAVAHEQRFGSRAARVAELCRERPGGREPLDARTLAGEVDWAVREEDCLDAEDFLLRRSDVGYGPRDVAERALETVVERMAALHGWDSARMDLARARALAELARRHAWRDDDAP